jgi:hypothetical protein
LTTGATAAAELTISGLLDLMTLLTASTALVVDDVVSDVDLPKNDLQRQT